MEPDVRLEWPWVMRLKKAMADRGWTVPDLAAAMGHAGDRTMIERLHKVHQGKVRSPRHEIMEDIARALGMTERELRYGEGGSSAPLDTGPEGHLIDLSAESEAVRRSLAPYLQGPDVEVWQLTTDALAGGPYRRGDYIVTDKRAYPRAGCFVVAEVNRRPIFRLYYPPILYALPLVGSIPHAMVDNISVTIRGVVVGSRPE